MAFKTQAEIWEHLLKNGRVKNKEWVNSSYCFLKDGYVETNSGSRVFCDFFNIEKWSSYKEPKPTKKVTLYRYTYQLCSGEIKTSYWTSLNFSEYYDENPDTRLIRQILKESKEVEYDDV